MAPSGWGGVTRFTPVSQRRRAPSGLSLRSLRRPVGTMVRRAVLAFFGQSPRLGPIVARVERPLFDLVLAHTGARLSSAAALADAFAEGRKKGRGDTGDEQPDPVDPSHFTIDYDLNGVRHTVDGWLVEAAALHCDLDAATVDHQHRLRRRLEQPRSRLRPEHLAAIRGRISFNSR